MTSSGAFRSKVNPGAAKFWRIFAIGLVVAGVGLLAWFFLTPISLPPYQTEGADPAVMARARASAEQIRARPRSAVAWGEMGMVLLANQLDTEASPFLARAETLDRADPRWPYLLGIAVLNRDPREAISHFRRAVLVSRGEPASTVARLRLAETLLANGDLDDAENHFEEIPVSGPYSACVDLGMGAIFVSRDDFLEAKTRWVRCSSSPWTRHRAEAQLTALARRMGEKASQDALLKDLLRRPTHGKPGTDPPWPDPFLEECLSHVAGVDARTRYAKRLEEQGKLDSALAILRELAEEAPTASTLLTLGITQGRFGQSEESERTLRKCLEIEPHSARAQHFLALAIFGQGERLKNLGVPVQANVKFEEASKWLQRAVETLPHYGEAYFQLGVTKWCLNQRAEAMSAFRKTIEIRPDLADAHLWLGKLLADDGQTKEADRHLRLAVQYSPLGDRRAQEVLDTLKSSQSK